MAITLTFAPVVPPEEGDYAVGMFRQGAHTDAAATFVFELEDAQTGDTLIVERFADAAATSLAQTYTGTISGSVATFAPTLPVTGVANGNYWFRATHKRGGTMLGQSIVNYVMIDTTDSVPDAFTIPTKTAQALNSLVPSDWVQLTGFSDPMTVSIVGGVGEYRLATDGAGTGATAYTSAPTTGVTPPRWVQVRRTTSTSELTTVSMTIDAGGREARWDVTTLSLSMVFTLPPAGVGSGSLSNGNLSATDTNGFTPFLTNRTAAGVKAFAVKMDLTGLFAGSNYYWGIALIAADTTTNIGYDGLAVIYYCATLSGTQQVISGSGPGSVLASGGPNMADDQFAGMIEDYTNAKLWFTHSGIGSGASYFGAAGPGTLYTAAQVASQIAAPGGSVAPGISFATLKASRPTMYYGVGGGNCYGVVATLQTAWPFAGGNASLPAGVTYVS